jgi:transposase
MLDAVPPISQPNGYRRKHPAKLHADKASDIPRCRRALRQRHITIRIARNGSASSQRLGRHRWVVERTLSWLSPYRRLRVRDERRAAMHDAFLALACALICFKALPCPVLIEALYRMAARRSTPREFASRGVLALRGSPSRAHGAA